MADVIGYEEKEARVIGQMQTGYPRFFEHPWLRRVKALVREDLGWPARPTFLLSSDNGVRELLRFMNLAPTAESAWEGLYALQFSTEKCGERASIFLQHTGHGPSSRVAESILLRRGILGGFFEEETVGIGPGSAQERALCDFLNVPDPEGFYLLNSGMNAFFASFRAIQEACRGTPRRRWIRLGWLYVDTIRILEGWGGEAGDSLVWHDVEDLDGFEERFSSLGSEIAGIVTETPTNPLLQTTDLERLRRIADRWGCALIVDPTLASTAKLDVLPFADVVVTSLTKYAVQSADLLMGAVLPNRERSWGAVVAEAVGRFGAVPDSRDIARLGFGITSASRHVARAAAATEEVVDSLQGLRGIGRIHSSNTGIGSAATLRACARYGPSVAPIFSLVLEGRSLEAVYDRLKMAKTPSFGAAFSMACPFMYLAHYGEIKAATGRAVMEEAGIHPDLIRISIGTESPETVVDSIRDALGAGG